MEHIINVERLEHIISVFGSFDENIRLVEQELSVSVYSRESELKVSGDEENVDLARRVLESLMELAARGEVIDGQTVRYVIDTVRSGDESKLADLGRGVVCITCKGKPVRAKTLGQKNYCEAIAKNTITFGVGPAGTGNPLFN